MVDTFPTHLFGFLDKEIDIERQTLKGGIALSGEQDVVSTDGGGRVFAEFTSGSVVDRSAILAWRAVKTGLEEGVTKVIVPFCEIRYTPYGRNHLVPHSDDTPFSDDTLYSGGGPVATIGANALLRATALVMLVDLPQPVIGGEWFAIEHPNKGWRAYRIKAIQEQAGGVLRVTFSPPLRDNVVVGETVNFKSPRCLMVQDGGANTKTAYGRLSEVAIRFVEAP